MKDGGNAMTASVTDLASFMALLKSEFFTSRHGVWIFRGHEDASYKLQPTIARAKHTAESIEEFERSIFRMFRRNAIQHLPARPMNNFEWLALAQHHGLPTRLLDWSYNPLVALYFSVRASEECDGEVCCLKADKRMAESIYESQDPFGLHKTFKFVPHIVTPRLFAQEGLFTIHNNPRVPLEENLRGEWRVVRIRVPNVEKNNILYQLHRIGINHAKLFPDLDGLTKHLKWQHSASPDHDS